jgi:hypothetical protein
MVSDILQNTDTTSAITHDGQAVFVEDIDSGSETVKYLEDAGLLTSWSGADKNGIKAGWGGLTLRTSSQEAFMEDYEKLLDVYKQMGQLDSGVLADDKGYQAIRRIIEQLSDPYEQY